MKRLCLLMVLLWGFLSNALADYNGHQASFDITFKDGTTQKGYNFISTVYGIPDYMEYEEFLAQNPTYLLERIYDDSTHLKFYTLRYNYAYQDYDSSAQHIYMLFQPKTISVSNILSISNVTLEDQSYAQGVSSIHNAADTLWMRKPAHETYYFGKLFCSHVISVHQNSKAVQETIKALQEIESSFDTKLEELENQRLNTDGEEADRLVEEMQDLEYSIDEKIAKILEGLEGEKVVVISFCTC